MDKELAFDMPKEKKDKNRKIRIICTVFLLLVIMIILYVIYYMNNHLSSLITRIESPNGNYSLVIYDSNITGSENESDYDNVITIVEKEKGNPYETTTVLSGLYKTIQWSNDSTKFAVGTSGELDNILIFDRIYSNCKNLDFYLDHAFQRNINEKVIEFGYTVENLDGYYEFQAWNEDNDRMLIYYEIKDSDGILHKGEFWYSYRNDNIEFLK